MASGFFVFLAMTLTHFVHAAAGDTPWKGYGTLTGAANFNPRIREGCDKVIVSAATLLPISQFQSTHPRGMRRMISFKSKTQINFNPRIREGCDSILKRMIS